MEKPLSLTTAQEKPNRVLITGGAGFIGSHLAETLLDHGHAVTVIDDLSTGAFENISHLVGRAGFRFAIESIADEMVLDRLSSESDLIFHLAAAVGVKLIVERPVHTIETNIMGTEYVLKSALRYRAPVVVASTSEVYGKGARTPFEEDDDVLIGPTCRSRWAYAASKMVDEFLALAYHEEKGLPVVICRLFNTVGPRQTGRYGMVIPRFVGQALAGEPLTIYGDGEQSRCFLHVEDCVDALIRLAAEPRAIGQVFNVGSTEEVTIRDLAERVLARVEDLGGELPPVDPLEERMSFVPYEKAYAAGFEDMRRRVPHLGKIERLVGWRPRKGLDAILEDVVLSFRSNANRL
jgi:UDP-glucose 4-epimerase